MPMSPVNDEEPNKRDNPPENPFVNYHCLSEAYNALFSHYNILLSAQFVYWPTFPSGCVAWKVIRQKLRVYACIDQI